MKRVAIYIRVSTEEQHLNGLSLQAQRKALEEYANQMNYTVVDYYADEGISARKPMKYRKELIRLLNDVKKHRIDMILVTKLDRWFRNIKDYNTTEEILLAHNCYWKTIYENYDSSTANGQMVINIMLSVNQAECDRTSERIKAVLDYKRSEGKITSGRVACYGYISQNEQLIKDPCVEHVVNDIFSHYFSTLSKRATYNAMKSKYGDLMPPQPTYAKMFDKTQYMGTVQGLVDMCEPYISKDQWHLICNNRDVSIIPQRTYYIFSGLVKCPCCGANLTGFVRTYKRNKGKIYKYPRYHCSVYAKDRARCQSAAAISESVIEKYMLDNVIPNLDEQIELHTHANSVNDENKRLVLEEELERLNLMFQKGRIKEAYYEEQYFTISNQLEQIGLAKCGVSENVINLLSGNWRELYDQLDNSHKNTFWKNIISAIIVDENRKLSGFYFLQ